MTSRKTWVLNYDFFQRIAAIGVIFFVIHHVRIKITLKAPKVYLFNAVILELGIDSRPFEGSTNFKKGRLTLLM